MSTRPLCNARANETCTCPRKPLTPVINSAYGKQCLESFHACSEWDGPRETGRPSSPSYPARNCGTSQEGLKKRRGPSRKMQVRRGNAALPRQAAAAAFSAKISTRYGPPPTGDRESSQPTYTVLLLQVEADRPRRRAVPRCPETSPYSDRCPYRNGGVGEIACSF